MGLDCALFSQMSVVVESMCFCVYLCSPAEPVLLRPCVLPQHTVLLLQSKTQVLQVLPGKSKQALRICGEREHVDSMYG